MIHYSPTRTGRRISRDAVAQRVRTHAATAAMSCPSLLGKKIHPHVLRHSCATSLLQAGVDTSVIALRLGHAGVRSTDAYVHADITITEKALALTNTDNRQTRPLPSTGQDPRVPRGPVTMPSRNNPKASNTTTSEHAPRHSCGVGIDPAMRTSA